MSEQNKWYVTYKVAQFSDQVSGPYESFDEAVVQGNDIATYDGVNHIEIVFFES